jgi:DNA-directed RNA polymerase subunit RPC12/RpoP
MEVRLRKPRRGDWFAALLRIGLLCVVLTVSVVLLLTPDNPLGWIVWAAISILSIGWLVRWHTRSFGYRCPKCARTFMISPWTNARSPNSIGRGGPRKYLRCPHCNQRSWCHVHVLVDRP